MLKKVLLPGPFPDVFHSKNACARRCQRRGEQSFSLRWQFRWVHTRVLICGDRVRCEMHAAFLASWQCAQVHTWITAVDFTFFFFRPILPPFSQSRRLSRRWYDAREVVAPSLWFDFEFHSSARTRFASSILFGARQCKSSDNDESILSAVATSLNYSNSLCLFEIKTSSVWSVVMKTPWRDQRSIVFSLVYSYGLSKYVCVSVHYIQFCVTDFNSRGNFRISLGRFDFKRSSY